MRAGCPERLVLASATTAASLERPGAQPSSAGKDRRPAESTHGCRMGCVTDKAGLPWGKLAGRLMRRFVMRPSRIRTGTSYSDLYHQTSLIRKFMHQ